MKKNSDIFPKIISFFSHSKESFVSSKTEEDLTEKLKKRIITIDKAREELHLSSNDLFTFEMAKDLDEMLKVIGNLGAKIDSSSEKGINSFLTQPNKIQIWFWDESGYAVRVIRRKSWRKKGKKKMLNQGV